MTAKKPAIEIKGSEVLRAAVAGLQKDYNKGAIFQMSQGVFDPVETIGTGALTLDLAIGGGIPRGMITEVIGPEAVGKSTLCMHIMANAQKFGAVVLVDTEHVFDPNYAAHIGVDIPSLFLSQPDFAEQGLEIVKRMGETGEVALIVVDSVAGLVPRAELAGEMGDAHVGVHARLMNQAMRKLQGMFHRTNTALVFTNQLRSKIGGYGNPETTPGGAGLKYSASVRLDMRRIEQIKDGTEIVGARTKVKVIKNKIAVPFRAAEFDIIYGEGISSEGCILDVALDLKLVALKGSYFVDVASGENLGQGREKTKIYLREHPESLGQYYAAAAMAI